MDTSDTPPRCDHGLLVAHGVAAAAMLAAAALIALAVFDTTGLIAPAVFG